MLRKVFSLRFVIYSLVLLGIIYHCLFSSFSVAFASENYKEPVTEFKEVSEDEFLKSFANASTSSVVDASGLNILEDTRYSSFTPSGVLGDGFKFLFDTVFGVEESPLSRDNLERIIKNNGFDAIYKKAFEQRAIDLVEYANNSTGGTVTGLKSAYVFCAKRKLLYPNTSNYEVDFLYFWKDNNHTAPDLTGVSIGDFYMQPNSALLCRYSSTGLCTYAYTDTSQFTLNAYTNSSTTPFTLSFPRAGSFSCTNADGTVETLTWDTSSGYFYDPSSLQLVSQPSVNSITSSCLVDAYNSNSSRYSQAFGDVLTNAQCFMTNGVNPTNHRIAFDSTSGAGSLTWWLTSVGNFSGNAFNSSLTNSADNIYATKAPVYNVYNNNEFKNGSTLTTNNVNNYSDYGITYNSDTNKFDLDLNALLAGIGAELDTKFKPVFDGVYSLQPDVGADFTDNTNNYLDIFDDYIVDIIDTKFPPSAGWQPPKYPAVNTSAYIPVTYPTIPTATYPQGYLESMGDTLTEGQDIFDTFGVLGIIIPIVIFLVLWRILGGR